MLGCCLLLVVSVANAQGERLRWLINDFPPFTEVGAQLPGRGIADDALRYLAAHLPQYRHEYEVASFARAYALMARGEPVCHATTLKLPGREKLMFFSRPLLLLPSIRVLVRADRLERIAPYVDRERGVDVARLLADSSLVTAISERRGYSPRINAALEEQGPQRHVLQAGVKFDTPIQQLMAGWIDYLFTYPAELAWYRQQHPQVSQAALQGLPIAGDPPYTLAYIACAHNAWGERVIHDIDEQLRLAGPRPPWVDSTLHYIDREEVASYERALARQRPFAQP